MRHAQVEAEARLKCSAVPLGPITRVQQEITFDNQRFLEKDFEHYFIRKQLQFD